MTFPDSNPRKRRNGFTRRFYRLMYGTLTWQRFDAIVARARRMRGWA